MKQKVIILAAVLATGVTLLVATFHLQTSAQRSEERATLARETGQENAAPTAMRTVQIEIPASVDPAAREARVEQLISSGYIPAQYRDLWLDPDYERIAEERFNVIPKIPRDPGETCEPLGVEDSHLCWNDYDYHPYLAYELGQLRTMAESDAVAAEAVAMRLPRENLEERLYYSLKASRLSGKSGPVMRFVYANVPSRQDPDYFNRMLDRYSLAKLGERMGYPYRFSIELQSILMKEFDLSSDELYNSLEQRREELLERKGGAS